MRSVLALVGVLALALPAAGQPRQPSISKKRGVSTMSNVQTAAAALQKLTSDDVLHGGAAELVQRAYSLLAGVQWEGVTLRAPSAADTARDSGFPVLVAFSQSSERGRQVVAGKSAIVVVTRADGAAGRWVVPVFPPPLNKAPDPEQPREADVPLDDGSTGMMAVERLDLKQHEALPWEAGRFAVRAIIYDWVSNTAEVTLTGPPPTPEPVAPARSVSRGDVNAPTVFPNFFKSKYSPEPPASGIALRLPVWPMPKGKPVPVFGSARLPAPAGEVQHASVLLVRPNILSPIVLDVDIPVAAADRRAGGMVDLYFAYDLNAVATAPLPPAAYQAYLVAGESTAGPYPLTIE